MGTNHLWNDIKKQKTAKLNQKYKNRKFQLNTFILIFIFTGVFILFTTTTLMLSYTLFVINILK